MPTEAEVWQIYQNYLARLSHFTEQIANTTAALLTDATAAPGDVDTVWATYQNFLERFPHLNREFASGLAASLSSGVHGAAGPAGPPGPAGAAATIAVGTTNTGAPGTNASVTNSGSSSAAVFNFTIPRGDVGPQGPPGGP